MSQKWTSVVTQAILGTCGIIFFVMSYCFNDGGTSIYASAGYYPMLVSGLIVLFSITGICSDLIGKEKTNEKKIDLSNIKNIGLVALALVIIITMWQILKLFYVGATIGVGILLIGLDPVKKDQKHIVRSVIIAVAMSIATYMIFEFALKIHV